MGQFEVIIPIGKGKAKKIVVEANNWMNALNETVVYIEATMPNKSFLCSVNENSTISVKELKSGKIFEICASNIKGARKEEIITAPVTAVKGAKIIAKVPPIAPDGVKRKEGPLGLRDLADDMDTESVIANVFEKIQEVHSYDSDREKGINFLLDLAMSNIKTESGSFFLTDLSRNDLFFGAARGPKSSEVSKFRVEMGQGIVGFCAKECTTLAISDVNKDPRFYKEISEKIGYPTYSILCTPVQHDGMIFGAIEVINKIGTPFFTEEEVNVIDYIGKVAGEYLNLF